MLVVDIIAKKREGHALTPEELVFLVDGYTAGAIPDYQMAAWLMAVCCRGMTAAETTALTLAMVRSGTTLDLRGLAPLVADKHSTGGVGDGTTLVVAPIVAACGVPVGKIAGRGLDFTGGTIDKLEAIPGFDVSISIEQFKRQLRDVGLVVCEQSADLVPADAKMYALRDVTATVQSMPLIASSVMSKKIAGGADAIVLDVKVGRGAFMKSVPAARRLAEVMIDLATSCGRRAAATLTSMDQPLGRVVGSALEVRQAIEILKGGGPGDLPGDLKELSLMLATELISLAGRSEDAASARHLAERALASGAALEKLAQMIRAQGGDPRVIDDPSLLPQAPSQRDVPAPKAGYVTGVDPVAMGRAVALLGGGRIRKGDPVDPAVGVVLEKKVGERVARGEPLAVIHSRQEHGLAEATALVSGAYQVRRVSPESKPLVLGVLRQER